MIGEERRKGGIRTKFTKFWKETAGKEREKARHRLGKADKGIDKSDDQHWRRCMNAYT